MSKQEKKNLTGVEKEVYRAFLEEKVLKYLMAVKVAPLCVSMKENEESFHLLVTGNFQPLEVNLISIATRLQDEFQNNFNHLIRLRKNLPNFKIILSAKKDSNKSEL